MIRALHEYGERIRAFRPNARLYLANVVIAGATMGVFRLLFNFYVLSLGYDEALLGNLVTTNSLTALIVALPVGYLADLLGRKTSLLLSGVVTSLAVAMMLLWPAVGMLYAANILLGVAQSLAGGHDGPVPDGEQRRNGAHLPVQLQLGPADGVGLGGQLDWRLPAHLAGGLAGGRRPPARGLRRPRC